MGLTATLAEAWGQCPSKWQWRFGADVFDHGLNQMAPYLRHTGLAPTQSRPISLSFDVLAPPIAFSEHLWGTNPQGSMAGHRDWMEVGAGEVLLAHLAVFDDLGYDSWPWRWQ